MTDSVLNVTNRYVQLSAGRVQTPTLAILTEREKEIKKFVPEPYWVIKAKIEKGIVADHKKGKIFDKKKLTEFLSNVKERMLQLLNHQ